MFSSFALVFCVPGILLGQGLPRAQPEEVGLSSLRLAQLMAGTREYVEQGKLAAASTYFWVDRQQELVALFLTQLAPSDAYPLRDLMRVLTYQALVD